MIIMKRFNVLFMVLCYTLCSVSAWSQHTVKGVVKDKETHPVIGASVIIRSLQDTLNHKGCITGENGQFTIEKIKSGKYRIEISFIGYTWKSHATLTLLATQDLPTFGYNMIDPLKSWCWGSILFYPFKISRFS